MVNEELKMANGLYPVFNSPMEGLGVLQEECYEAKKDWNLIWMEYDALQYFLCQHQTKAAADVAMKMKLRAMETMRELVQVAAMCQKFIDSEVLW
jgi:hypothetical protein